jgi:hypothetical protein
VHQLSFEFFLLFDPRSGHNQALVKVSPEFTVCSFNELTQNLFALGLIDVCFFTFCMDKTQDHFNQVTTRKKPVVFLIAQKYMRCIHIPAGNL